MQVGQGFHGGDIGLWTGLFCGLIDLKAVCGIAVLRVFSGGYACVLLVISEDETTQQRIQTYNVEACVGVDPYDRAAAMGGVTVNRVREEGACDAEVEELRLAGARMPAYDLNDWCMLFGL